MKILPYKLINSGVSGNLIVLIEKFFDNRYQAVVIYISDLMQGHTSDVKIIFKNTFLFSIFKWAKASASALNSHLLEI